MNKTNAPKVEGDRLTKDEARLISLVAEIDNEDPKKVRKLFIESGFMGNEVKPL